MDLKELESGVDPGKHWYYQSKKIPLISYVKKVFSKKNVPLTLIDVGSGSGFFMYELYEEIPEMISKVFLVDIGYSDEEITVSQGNVIEKTRSLPAEIENAVVVMMDVLEHLEDDIGMLKAISNNSKGENNFFITVPAFMDLWSGHDVYLGHYRRYTKNTLALLLKNASYKKDGIYYIYGAIFPLVWMARKMSGKRDVPQSDMKPVSSFLNASLKTICSVEMNFRRMNLLGGVTVVAEGRFEK